MLSDRAVTWLGFLAMLLIVLFLSTGGFDCG